MPVEIRRFAGANALWPHKLDETREGRAPVARETLRKLGGRSAGISNTQQRRIVTAAHWSVVRPSTELRTGYAIALRKYHRSRSGIGGCSGKPILEVRVVGRGEISERRS